MEIESDIEKITASVRSLIETPDRLIRRAINTGYNTETGS